MFGSYTNWAILYFSGRKKKNKDSQGFEEGRVRDKGWPNCAGPSPLLIQSSKVMFKLHFVNMFPNVGDGEKENVSWDN
jgi:hypothetical protein